jgi:hypothetical protein
MLRSDILIALPLHLAIDFDDAAGIDCDAAAVDKGSFVIPYRCEVFLAGVVVCETCAGAGTTPVVKFDLRPTAGDEASRGDGDIANLVLSTTAAGKVLYDRVAKGEVLEPGMEVMVQLATAATGGGAAGHVKPFLLVKQIPEVLGNLSDMVETA